MTSRSGCPILLSATGATPVGGSDGQSLHRLDLLATPTPTLQQVILAPTMVAGPTPGVAARLVAAPFFGPDALGGSSGMSHGGVEVSHLPRSKTVRTKWASRK